MPVFSRSTRVVVLWLFAGLSIAASALPTSPNLQRPTPNNSSNEAIQRIGTLQTEIDVMARTIAKLGAIADTTVFIPLLVVKVNTYAEALSEIRTDSDLDEPAMIEADAKSTSIIGALFNLGSELVATFGHRLADPFVGEIDSCILTLLYIPNVNANSAQSPSSVLGSSEYDQVYLTHSASTFDSTRL